MKITKPILLNLPERIITDRLILKVPQAGDGAGLHKAVLDGYGDFIKWLTWPEEKPTLEMVEQDCRRHHAEFILRQDIRYLIINRKTKEIMGRCGFPPFQLNWAIPMFGISYFLAKRFQGNGYATEAVNILTQLAFKHMQARKVEIKVDPENQASLRIPERLWFALEAKQKGNWLRKDKEELADLWTYAMFDTKKLPVLKIDEE